MDMGAVRVEAALQVRCALSVEQPCSTCIACLSTSHHCHTGERDVLSKTTQGSVTSQAMPTIRVEQHTDYYQIVALVMHLLKQCAAKW